MPVILRNIKKHHSKYLGEGLHITSLKNEEDTQISLRHHMLFSPENDQKRRCTKYNYSGNWEPNDFVDGALMTGQSPASAFPLEEALPERLSA